MKDKLTLESIYSIEFVLFLFSKIMKKMRNESIFILRNDSMSKRFLALLASVQNLVDQQFGICQFSCLPEKYRLIDFAFVDRMFHHFVRKMNDLYFDRSNFVLMDVGPLPMKYVDSSIFANELNSMVVMLRNSLNLNRCVVEVILTTQLYNFLRHRPKTHRYEIIKKKKMFYLDVCVKRSFSNAFVFTLDLNHIDFTT